MSVVLLLQLFLLCVAVQGDQVEIFLNGDSWSLSDTEGRVKAIKAQVPGVVHLDLMQNGIIGDPYYSWNDLLYQWIGYADWQYSRTFDITSDQIEGKTVWLKCDGLDTVANISINDQPVGTANNMYRRYFFDITGAVNPGQNIIAIDFESASNYSNKRAAEYPYQLHCNSYFNYSFRCFVRKTQSDFGWNWAPAFVPAGIWQNISIVTFNDIYVSYVIPKTGYNESSKSYYVTVTVCLIIPKPTTIDVSIATNLTEIPVPPTLKNISVTTITNNFSECYTIQSDPIAASVMEEKYLWWPVGVKWPPSPPTLVEASTNVTILKDGNEISSVNVVKRIGFRNIKVIQDPVGDNGLTFYFQMSTSSDNYPLYAKGSNFIPMDAFVTRATPEYARSLLESAVATNQNMIRIWGGGLYQPDWFYDLCDEMGIMVWQEFMFSDGLYPRDIDFLANVREEIKHVVRRLGHHPSIVLWSGNNENQAIAYYRGTATIVDYSVLYDGVIKTTLWEEDNSRIFWPSSPSDGFIVDNQERGLFIQKWSTGLDSKFGDLHWYDNKNDYCTDVTKFPDTRFASEFGYQSYPSFNAIRNISNIQDWSNDSPLMLHRQRAADGNKVMQAQMAMFFHLPNNTKQEDQFRDFIYLSQVIQAICIDAEAQHYRRMISTDGILTRGTLYWQLNDIWQAQSWASLEWSGQWKLLHHFMQRTYERVLVSPFYLNGRISIFVVVDVAHYDVTYDLQVDVITWTLGKAVNSFSKSNLKSTGFTGVEVFNETMEDIFKGTTAEESFLHISITNPGDNKTVVAENSFFPSNFTNVDLPEAKLTASNFLLTPNDMITFSLTSDAVAPYVYLTNMDYDGTFSENGFLVMPQKTYEITFTPLSTLKEIDVSKFQQALSIRTIRDTYTDKPY